ncbi:hypothetical protein [Ruminococcus albus]|uniref:Uncharacterized protein n=1 Tax=Ruminococcus albus TaxID=1264 RepID=A0A1I1HXS0_RUMAL|nr:hypothetical protein [Ruminococcus albus]SFC28887.1 hypothetical protein SAMN02910406_01453 [Ruminococcus albus]
MRIELNAGGLGGRITVGAFEDDFQTMVNKSRDVISSFKAVRKKTTGMSGGVGNLQGALDSIDRRIKTEEQKVEKMESVGKKFGEFLANATATDKRVAELVNVNKENFYSVNPWARPKVEKKKSFWKRAGEWLGDTAFGKAVKKHWKSIVKITVGVVVIAGLAALVAFTGGAAAPLLGLALKGAIVTAFASAAVGGGAAAYKYYKENGTMDGASGVIFDAAANGFMEGAITGAFTGAAGAVGGLAVNSGVSVGKAVALHMAAGGLAAGTGNVIGKSISIGLDKGTLKGSGRTLLGEFAFGFASGAITSGISLGVDRLKFNAYTKIQTKLDAGNANAIEKLFATSKLTYKNFESTLRAGNWTATGGNGWAAYKGTLKALDCDLAKKALLKDSIEKTLEKSYGKLTILINKDSPYEMPKVSNFADVTADNVITYLHDKYDESGQQVAVP